MTNKTSRLLALLFFVPLLAELAFLSAVVPLDAAAYGWVQAHRSCALDYLNARLHDWPIITLVVLSVFTLLWLCARRQWTEAQHGTLVIATGLFLNEVLKTGFERARPSVLPPLLAGNSFPSGHVTGALLLAGTLGFFVVRQRWAAWVKLGGAFVLYGLVSGIVWQRLYLAHHWLSDIIGSLLLAGAWLCFVLPRPALFGASRRFVLACVGLLVCYQVFYFFPATRFALPSATTVTGEPLLTLSFGESGTPPLLQGAWGDHTREPAGPITWMQRGEASVELRFPVSQTYTLKLAVRPFVQSKTFACFPLEVLVNQQPAGRLLLYRGWREYVLRLDPTWIVPGTNVIAFRVGADFPDDSTDQRTVAFRYLHLFAERR